MGQRLFAAGIAFLFSFAALADEQQAGPADKDKPTPTEWTGKLRTGVVAVGAETTGIVLEVKGAKYELDLARSKGLRETADRLNGKAVVVKGKLETRKGVEVKERKVIVVTSLKEAPEPRK